MTALRIVFEPRDEDGRPDWWSAEPGDMWPCLWGSHRFGNRPHCWVIRMPGTAWVWHINDVSSRDGEGFWEVTGEPPDITVKPSINIGPEIWHGWITAGDMAP